MEDYMLLIEGDGSRKSPEKMQNQLQEYMAWMEKWKSSGQYVEGSPFKTEGVYLTHGNQTEEGEFLNPETTIGGYIHVKAENLEGASEIAKECPLLDGCGIYVRPFLKM